MKRFKIYVIVILFGLFSTMLYSEKTFALEAPVNIYYVSTQGNDTDPGTEASPWKTIQKAANTIKAGDTVYIRGGVYNERVVLKTSGSQDKYITFTNYPGEAVTIDGTGIDWGYDWNSLININRQSYIILSGLNVKNSRWFGIGSTPDDNGSDDIIIKNCSTYNTKGAGIIFTHASNITIDGNSVEQACTGSKSTQEAISLNNVATFEIKNNHVFNITNSISGAGGEGIDAKDGCSNGKIYNNIVNDIPNKVGIYVDAYNRHQYNIEVYQNKVFNCRQGIVVATERNGLLENVNINNNVVYNIKNWGIAVSGYTKGLISKMQDIYIRNNLTYNITDGNIYLNNKEAKNIIITGNILGGGTSQYCSPIYLNGGNLKETTIDTNFISTIVKKQPIGTNYTLLSDKELQNVIIQFQVG